MPKEHEIDSLICPTCKKTIVFSDLVMTEPNKLVPETHDRRQLYCRRCGYQIADVHKSVIIFKQSERLG